MKLSTLTRVSVAFSASMTLALTISGCEVDPPAAKSPPPVITPKVEPKADSVKSDMPKPDMSKPDMAKPDMSKPDMAKPGASSKDDVKLLPDPTPPKSDAAKLAPDLSAPKSDAAKPK